ncbi:hypothetical protein CPJ18_06495 [Agrobacterium rosae]|uniref:HTH lysR-type domain-containing protein n=2 Tax=Agrobacterium rosae TaxID=1972867 RepID=A0AAE5S0B8_9HYPH|nr:LysR family transcriptional regulator [Agrobacterium rosae]KAA3516457.1 LysR family transcriptional regulator [Agrobacterium rosae]MQB50254.1 LysR family transcriptional regulator [Agrobacterium rosae]POO52892.1 hypothetical protein CPJ18_06495 [Agrobacterium rosae]
MKSMFTIKQMEALYWVTTLGGFEAAASYLNVTQSTISKRIGELESQFSTPLFDRKGRHATLTGKGEDIREIAEQILRLNDRLAITARSANAAPFRFRLGVTDLVALSWLPELLARILERNPDMRLEPEIDLTSGLLARLIERKIDFVICPRVSQHPQFVNSPLGEIELVWMCSPKLYDQGNTLQTEDLIKLPLLIQSPGSILRPILHDVIDNPKLPFTKTISCNNMMALAELAAFGMGITILPKAFFSRHVNEGRLRIVKTNIPLPKLEYFITYRNDYNGAFFEEIANLCRQICDFTARE